DDTSMTGGTLVLGAAGGTGTVDVETGEGATLDGVTVTAFAAADGIKVGQTSDALLLLENGTSMTGGTLALGATFSQALVDIEGVLGVTLDGVTVTSHNASDTILVGHS